MMKPLHRSEERESAWRKVVTWLLCHPEILTKKAMREEGEGGC
jgi:hypothetical protein